MSLICGSLAWLKDFEAAEISRLKEKSSRVDAADVGEDWFSAQAQQLEVKHESNLAKKALMEIEQQLKKISLYPTQLKKHKVRCAKSVGLSFRHQLHFPGFV
jgi:hypothetical protein